MGLTLQVTWISKWQDVDPSDVTFDCELPDEILSRGWLSVLEYLRELYLQGWMPVREARAFLLGEGEQGKTSLLIALLDHERNCAAPISRDDRTVGIDIKVCVSSSY